MSKIVDKLVNQIRKIKDNYNGGFIFQMPCIIVNVNTDKILYNNNEEPKPYVKASVKWITGKNEYKTATAICYFKDDENLEVLETAQADETPMLLEARFDEDANEGKGGMFLKLSALVYGSNIDIDDFDFEGLEVTERAEDDDAETNEELRARRKAEKKAKKKAKKAKKTADATA